MTDLAAILNRALCAAALVLCAAPGVAETGRQPDAVVAAFAYVPKVGRAEADVINANTGAVVTTIGLPTGYSGAAASLDGARVYLIDQAGDRVTVINTQTNSAITHIPVASRPWTAVVSPDSSRVYVSSSSGSSISVISAASNTIIDSIPVLNSTYGIAITPDGSKLYLAVAGGSFITAVNTTTHALTHIGVGRDPLHVAISPDGSRAYVTAQTGDNVTVIDTATDTAIATIPVGDTPYGIAVSTDNARVYVSNAQSNTVSVISAASLAVTATIPVGARPTGIDVSPDGSRVFVAQQNSSNLAIISTSSNSVIGTVNLGSGASPFAMGRFVSFVGAAPAFTGNAPPNGSYRVPYSHTLTATGTPAPTFKLQSGTLPAGLSLDPVTGVISGTPTAVSTAVTGTVRASNGVGTPATLAYSIAIAATVPDAPTIGTLTAGNGSVSVEFTPPQNDGGSPIFMYNAFCDFAASAPASPIVMNNLPNGVPVRCRVNAVNGVGGGLASEYSNEVTPQAPTSMQLQTSSAPAIAGAAVTLTATIAPVSAGGTVEFSADTVPIEGCTAAVVDNGSALCSTTFATAGTRAISAAYNGDAAHIATSATLTGGQAVISTPSAPQIISAAPLDQAAQIVFAAAGDDGGSSILDYTATCTPGPVTATANSLSIDVTGLSNNVAYRCSVRARNAAGTSAASAQLSVIPGASGSSTDLSITKTNDTDFVNGGDAIGYVIIVTNPGPAAVIGARVEDAIGAGTDFSSADWSCTPQGGSACPSLDSGDGALDVLVDLPALSSVRIDFDAVPSQGPETPVSNTASVTPPAGITDPDLDNNIASDGPDMRGIFRDEFE
jgi:uncharacterized repeat protein (TIGR01451 family)